MQRTFRGVICFDSHEAEKRIKREAGPVNLIETFLNHSGCATAILVAYI